MGGRFLWRRGVTDNALNFNEKIEIHEASYENSLNCFQNCGNPALHLAAILPNLQPDHRDQPAIVSLFGMGGAAV